MYKTRLMLVGILLFIGEYFAACGSAGSANDNRDSAVQKVTPKAIEVKDTIPVEQETVTIKSDTALVKSNIMDFLRWYKLNYKKANSYPILTKDSAGNYIVNHTAFTDYLSFIKSSRLVSPAYISYWKTYFDDKESELKTYPINNVVPEGFDFDLVLITQKPEAILNKIDVLRYSIISMSDSAALIGLKLPRNRSAEYEVAMIKEKGSWQIEFISTPNYD